MHKWGYVDNKALTHEGGEGAGAAEHERSVSLCLKLPTAGQNSVHGLGALSPLYVCAMDVADHAHVVQHHVELLRHM